MKLFVTDYDDTLYTSDERLKINILKLKKLQEKDFIIMISTGRSYPSIKMQIDKYDIPYDYVCCADGSIIYDNQGKIILSFSLNNDIIKPFINFYQNLNYEEIQFSYSNGYSNLLKNDDLLGINIVFSNNLLTNEIKDDFLDLKEKFPHYNFLAYRHPNYSYLCVKPNNVSKAFAIQKLCQKLKISKNNVYVIGDSENDLEMIINYHGVGMKNSCEDVLKIVSKTYSEVSKYIDEILSNNKNDIW